MGAESSFTLHLEQMDGYEFKVRFDTPGLADLVVDESAPLGAQRGPSPARLLTASVAHCLSASLLFCTTKAKVPPRRITATAVTSMARDEHKRLRVGAIHITLDVETAGREEARFLHCVDLFEDFCVVTASVRRGVPITVSVTANGEPLPPPHDEEP